MNRYPDNEWQEILGNCDVQVALGCTDELTATHLSSRTGDITVGVSSTGKMLNSWQVSNYTTQYRETSSVGKRKLLTMDEVLRMPLDKELLIIRGQKVRMLDKYDFSEHPESQNLIPFRATDYVPQWAADEFWFERNRKYADSPPEKKKAPTFMDEMADPEPVPNSMDTPEPEGKPKKSGGKHLHTYRKIDDSSNNQQTMF